MTVEEYHEIQHNACFVISQFVATKLEKTKNGPTNPVLPYIDLKSSVLSNFLKAVKVNV